jgi:hypothetical protein
MNATERAYLESEAVMAETIDRLRVQATEMLDMLRTIYTQADERRCRIKFETKCAVGDLLSRVQL